MIASANPSGPSPSGNSSQSAAEHNNKVGTQGDPEYQFLNFSQSVYGVDSANPTALKPGDKFTYQFNLGCSETNCEDASLADQLPAALQGFAITDFTVSPSLQANVQWKEGGVAQPSMPAIVGAGTSFTLTPGQQFVSGGTNKTGLVVGINGTATLTLQVPANFSPSDSRNKTNFDNSATLSASNSKSVTANATAQVSIDPKLEAKGTGAFDPANAQYFLGAAETLKLNVRNTSNINADKLVVQMPQDAQAIANATRFDSDNPFRFFDFDNFGATVMPAGATQVQTDAYVKDGNGKWNWVTGVPGTSFALPSGVSAANVGGLRFTYTGTMAPNAATANPITLNLKQRSTDRNDASNSPLVELSTQSSVNAVVGANASQGSQTGIPTASAPAAVTLSPAQLSVTVGESFTPARHLAGNKSTGMVALTNGNSSVEKMEATVGKGFFSSDIQFDGFKDAIAYPSGADSGTVVYHMLDNTQPNQTVTFANGATPAPPTGDIASFDIKFGSTPSGSADNPIAANATTSLTFIVKSASAHTFPSGQTTEDFTDAAKATVTAHNTATATGSAPAATMTLVKPRIKVTVGKTVSPNEAVPIGHPAVVSYSETTGAITDYLQPNVVTVEDSWVDKTIDASGTIHQGTPESDGNNFWNVFNFNAIESTPIPEHTKLTVSVKLPSGWVDLDVRPSQNSSYIYSLDAAHVRSKLSAAHSGATPDQVTGIRFKLESDPGSTAFSGSTAIAQYVSFTARASKRDGSGAIDLVDNPDPQKPTKYNSGNTTSLTASGTTDDGDTITSNALDEDSTNQNTVGVLAFRDPAYNSGDDFYEVNDWISATFTNPAESDADMASVPALSSKNVTSHLKWGIEGDMNRVTLKQAADVTDYPDAGAHNDMWNDVFDLVSINPIATSDTPYTNGWYLKYDKITQVRIYQAGSIWNTGSWSVVPAPGGSWQNADHSFKGYTPSAGAITGFEITLEPDDAARTADITAVKPYVPEPGTGIVAAAQTRDFAANWKLRDKKRGTNSFVTGSVSGVGTRHAQPQNVRLDSQRATPEDSVHHPSTVDYRALSGGKIDIADYKAAVKKRDGGTYDLLVPPHGVSAPASSYPTQTYDISATNDSPNRASYLRIVTPSECDTTNQTGCYTANTSLGATQNPFTVSQIPDMRTGKLDSASTMPNMFNRQTLTHIDISADDSSQVSLNDSRVYILRYTPTNYATGTGIFTVDPTITTAAQANAMTEAQLADVVAVAVTFQGSSDPATVGPTLVQGNYVHLKLTTRVRDTLRSTDEPFIPTRGGQSETNRATAQIYAPITDSDANDQPTKFVKSFISYRTGSLQASIGETIAPNDLVDVHPQVPQTVTMNANSTDGVSADSTLSPTKVTLTSWPDGQGKDGSSTKTGHFWKNFDFTGLTMLTFPENATKVKIGVYGPFGPGGSMGWKDGDAQAQLPAGNYNYTMPVTPSQYNDIQGLRFVFTNPDSLGHPQLFTNSGNVSWASQIQYQVVQREHVRGDDSRNVAYPGTEPNAVSSEVESKLNGGVNPDQSTSADTSTPMTWGLGTFGLGVSEVANNGTPGVAVGQMVPWDVYFSNIGTGYLDIDKVTADLPAELRYTGQGGPGDPAHPIAFTPGAVGGAPNSGKLNTMPTLDSSNPSKLVFSWPAGKSRMLPGEVVKMTIWLEAQPGAVAGANVNLPVTVTSKEHLTNLWYVDGHSNSVTPVTDGISPLSIGGQVTAFVTPSSGENVYIVGGVQGSKTGAINTLDPTQTCTPTLTALDGHSYYRAPCRANTAVGGKDNWVLHMVNAGTTTEKQVQFFEQLPAKHDKRVVASSDYRGSAYRPELTGAPKVVGAPAGTTATIEASTDTSPCVDTWSTLPGISSTPANTSCSASTWIPSASVTDWSKVTGLRVTLDFTTSTDGGLIPGKGADVTYTSKNAPATSPGSLADDSDPTVPVSLDQAAGVQEAWAQFGILYTSADNTMHPAAPQRFGTRIETGSLKVDKAVGGAAASAYTPQQVRASITCKDANGDPMLFGGQSHGLVTLNKQIDGTYAAGRLAGIPLSVDGSGNGNTVCTVSEDGPLGQFGEAERTVSVNGDSNTSDSDTMNIITNDTLDGSGNPTNAVVAAQSAKITNTYRFSGLSVTKKVDTKADKGSFGPFNFKAACRTSDGQTVLFGGAESTTFTLSDGQTWNAPADTIPANATCTITETDTSGADKTVFTGDNVTDNTDGSASIRVGNGSAGDIAHLVASTVTNHYDAGTLTVNRTVSGDGASRYGNVPVTFKAVCDYRGHQVLNEQFDLSGTSNKSFGVLPAGTQCTITQVNDSGATKHTFLPANGKVTIATLAQASAADAAAVADSSVPGSVPGTPTLVNDLSSVTVAETDKYDVSQVPIVLKRTGDESAVQSRGNGPFKVKATCTYQRDGKPVAIDLGGDGTFILTGANGYSTTLNDILLGAHCTVEQTDSAGADSTSVDPANGDVTVVEAADKNMVTITDVFRNKPSLAGLFGSSMARTGAAVAGIAVLIVILLAGGAIILCMRRRSTGGDESDVALDNPDGSDGSDDSGNQDGSDDSGNSSNQDGSDDPADSDASGNPGNTDDSNDSVSPSHAS